MKTSEILVVAPNFKKRLSGVTSTIVQLVPLQAQSLPIVAFGPGLPGHLPKLKVRQLPALWFRPRAKPVRIWHARRNVEMLPGIFMRDVLRMPLKLVFTSAAQRRHTAYTRFLISRMDKVIATSQRSAAYLEVPNQVIMHGIDLQRFRPAGSASEARASLGLPERRTIGCFGRIRHQKGTDLFVDAMIALLPQNPEWQAVITGRATAEHAQFDAVLKEKVKAAGLADRILFKGEVEHPAPYYQALDLFVAPQRWEGFGLTPLEAMASGVPVVAADVGVFADVVTDQTGQLVPADDPVALTRAIADWMGDRQRLTAASGAAYSHAQATFPLQREAAQIDAVYTELWNQPTG
ncbi:glycosyltransferase family 4 protein [Aureimonas fodinaquatilis]|uniref:Glycosyltransferase family 4 protein n=1 Tax=Aureimonas fodinaquatilis TaxID=2565783 RepID=A0A5B0DQH0_9HYPH|nr:glycosyltransferase family 4 protein [Aureimonas fodinaquatilis]KAA0969034.1 glycosyltransferase family 4 protein [Aureimonas fodinaquatilis]